MVYFVLAIYLNQVIPSIYGVPKHPLFCLKRCLRGQRSLYKAIYGGHEDGEADEDTSGGGGSADHQGELKGEDDDSR